MDQTEAEKLLHRGGTWLPRHPERGFITRRYLRYLAGIRLMEGQGEELAERSADSASPRVEETESGSVVTEQPQAAEPDDTARGLAESALQPKLTLHDQRLQQVAHEIYQLAPKRVLDLGCGEGKLLRLLLRQPKIEFIRGMDVSHQALSRASQPPAPR